MKILLYKQNTGILKSETMKLTYEVLEQHGYKKINNSMWRNGDITIQNAYTMHGDTLYDRIMSTRKAFKACHKGKFAMMLETVNDFNNFIKLTW